MPKLADNDRPEVAEAEARIRAILASPVTQAEILALARVMSQAIADISGRHTDCAIGVLGAFHKSMREQILERCKT